MPSAELRNGVVIQGLGTLIVAPCRLSVCHVRCEELRRFCHRWVAGGMRRLLRLNKFISPLGV